MPYVAAATVGQGWNTIVGLGRGAFAYPDFAKDLLRQGTMDPLKVCIGCSSCTQIMRDDGRTGCVVRDPDVYAPILQEGLWKASARIREAAARCRACVEPTCAAHCPSRIDIPTFLKLVAEGQEQEAYRVLRRANLLPEICGYVCPVEVQCQGHCVEQHLGEHAIPIARIQRYIAERARDEDWTALDIPDTPSGRRVAVIGAGPAGLACAAGLLERGHQVTVIDRAGQAGGKAVSVIPRNRLPVEDANAEILSIFQSVGSDRLLWRWNTGLGPDYKLADVIKEGFGRGRFGLWARQHDVADGRSGAPGGSYRCPGIPRAAQPQPQPLGARQGRGHRRR